MSYRDEMILISFHVHDLLHVCNKWGLGMSLGPTIRWKENVRKSHLLLGETWVMSASECCGQQRGTYQISHTGLGITP